jgi:segregation and condensation protein B
VPEINDIRGVDSGGVIGTLLDRKLITTAGRKQVIGRPILYKTTKEFLMRFGLKDVGELPSMEEFEKLVAESFQGELIPTENAVAEAVTPVAEVPMESGESAIETGSEVPTEEKAS